MQLNIHGLAIGGSSADKITGAEIRAATGSDGHRNINVNKEMIIQVGERM
jgi:hypothetical protein